MQSYRYLLLGLACAGSIFSAAAQEAKPEPKPEKQAQTGTPSELDGLDDFIRRMIKEWKVPGLAVAVVHNGQVVHVQGYGYRDLEKQEPVTPNTLFAIGSITKSFTAAGLGMLVDEGKLDWDVPVRRYMPDFQLHDRFASEQITARDLVTHRSGLPRHDYVWYADPNRSRNELFASLRHLEPSKDFRSAWQYQNLMFMAAGVLAERLSGQPWEQFTRNRIVERLGMTRTNFSVADSQKADDVALPYTKVKADVSQVPFHDIDAIGPAGSVNSTAAEMARYVQWHIDKGKHSGEQLLSTAQAELMQSPHAIVPASMQSPRDEELGDLSYGLGLMVSTYRGTRLVEHGGSIDGFVSLMGFLPRKKIGVVVLSNLSGTNPVPTIVARNVYDRLLEMEPVDWSARIKGVLVQAELAQVQANKSSDLERKRGTSPSHALGDYAGRYRHPAYGVVQIEHDASLLRVATAGYKADLQHVHYDIFETAEELNSPLSKKRVTFLYNQKGDIDRIAIPMESAVSDIVFRRLPDEQLQRKDVLLALAGEYQLGVVTVSFALRGSETLTLAVPGQPIYELVPTRNYAFDIKGLNGYSTVFKRDSGGSVIEVAFVQPNGTFVAKRKGLDPARTGSNQNDTAEAKVGKDDQASPSRHWTPQLMMEVRKVSQVRPSPDGKLVAYCVTTHVTTPEKSEPITQVHRANADGSNSVQLTQHEKSSNNPQWSPDGQWLAFTSERAGKNNLYLMRVAGGEPEQITDLKSNVASFAWSPDGKAIAYTMADPKSEQEEKNEKGKDDWRWVEEDQKMNRLYLVPIAKDSEGNRAVKKLTGGNYHVATTARVGVREFDWSPDGKSIAFAHRRSPIANDWTTSDVSIVNLATGEVTPLAATGAAEFCPIYSPDGQSIAILSSDDPPRWAGSYVVHVLPAEGGSSRPLPATRDHQPGLIGWSSDGEQLYIVEFRGTVSRVSAVHAKTGAIVDLNSGDEVIAEIELNRTGSFFGLTSHQSHRPPEGYVTRPDRFVPVQVSRANASLADVPLGKVELVRWKSFDGQEIEGILTYPVGYEAGKRVPLLLQVHGGPMGVFSRGYQAAPSVYPNAAFAAAGYAILQPNPRGSSGYGKDFRFANYKDWGGGDYRDIIAGVDHVIELGIADPDRLGVMGWSYGGYMTSWIITQTGRFKAASVGAGVTNLASFTGTADIPSFLRDYLGGEPWEAVDLYRTRSAVFNARGVRTPTLVQHGEADVRVPVSQGYEFFNALKQQGVTTRMLVLPRQPHGPTEPKMILKIMQTNLEWFDQYVRDVKVADVP